MYLPHEIETSLKVQFGTLKSFTPATGGCINNGGIAIFDQEKVFLKWNSANDFPGMFEAEARGLDLLRKGSLKIPFIIGIQQTNKYSYIILEPIYEGASSANYWENLGSGLADIHKLSNDVFGLDHDNYMGSLAQANDPFQNWIEFFIEKRIKPQVALAYNHQRLTNTDLLAAESFYKHLEDILPSEKPSLVHGDLWSGNIMRSETGQPVLIDPAVSFSHREVDLAMTKLFGGFDSKFYKSYHEAFPLVNGFENRIKIYQLYPLLIHLNLFGRSYYNQCHSILSNYA